MQTNLVIISHRFVTVRIKFVLRFIIKTNIFVRFAVTSKYGGRTFLGPFYPVVYLRGYLVPQLIFRIFQRTPNYFLMGGTHGTGCYSSLPTFIKLLSLHVSVNCINLSKCLKRDNL